MTAQTKKSKFDVILGVIYQPEYNPKSKTDLGLSTGFALEDKLMFMVNYNRYKSISNYNNNTIKQEFKKRFISYGFNYIFGEPDESYRFIAGTSLSINKYFNYAATTNNDSVVFAENKSIIYPNVNIGVDIKINSKFKLSILTSTEIPYKSEQVQYYKFIIKNKQFQYLNQLFIPSVTLKYAISQEEYVKPARIRSSQDSKTRNIIIQ